MSNDLVMMTESERTELMAALQRNFGPCTCRPGNQCAGHQFLAEPNRVERLLWVRRTGRTWQGAEQAREVAELFVAMESEQDEPIAEVEAEDLFDDSDLFDPEPPSNPDALPW